MRLTGVHSHGNGSRCGMAGCAFTPIVRGNLARCRCAGYPATTLQGDCTICGAGFYETLEEWQDAISGGFVEIEEKTFPVTITAYRGEKAFKVYGVIEDSISSKVDREGNVILSFETVTSPNEIGYIPCVDWYTTELES